MSVIAQKSLKPVISGTEPDGGGKKARKTPVFKQRSNAVKTISKAVTSAESMLALAQNLKRVKLAFVLDRDGTVTVSDISFTAVSGPVVIDVTGVDLVEFVRAAYDLSQPQGMGHLQFMPGPLSADEARSIVDFDRPYPSHVRLSVDYLRGRSVKLVVFREGEKLWIRDSWFDHSPHALAALLSRVGVKWSPERADGSEPA